MKLNQVYPKAYLIAAVATASVMLLLKYFPFPHSFSDLEVHVYRLLASWFLHSILFLLGFLGLYLCYRGYPLHNIALLLLLTPIAALFSWAAYEPWHFYLGLTLTNSVFLGVCYNTWRRVTTTS